MGGWTRSSMLHYRVRDDCSLFPECLFAASATWLNPWVELFKQCKRFSTVDVRGGYWGWRKKQGQADAAHDLPEKSMCVLRPTQDEKGASSPEGLRKHVWYLLQSHPSDRHTLLLCGRVSERERERIGVTTKEIFI